MILYGRIRLFGVRRAMIRGIVLFTIPSTVHNARNRSYRKNKLFISFNASYHDLYLFLDGLPLERDPQ